MSPRYHGCIAFHTGMERGSNPFQAGSIESKQWFEGWDGEYYYTYGCYP